MCLPRSRGSDETATCSRNDRARDCGVHVPFAWVAADTVYGVGDIERDLRRVGKGYVLGVSFRQALVRIMEPDATTRRFC